MTPHDQAAFTVRFGWGLEGLAALAPADVVVIVDVLSFCTTVDVPVAAGVTVLPYRFKDLNAANFATERDALLAVGRTQAGPDHPYSLSPVSVRHAPPGLRLELPSPNGATLSLAASAPTVVAGRLRNRSAVGELANCGSSVAVIAAGERWPDGGLRPAFEDLGGAGAIIETLAGRRSPEAAVAAAAFRAASEAIVDRLLECASGRELDEAGWTEDVLIAAQLDASAQVPELCGDAYRATR